ncbi:MAG: carboxypeptidase regulatory-like domain-containing protein, partial [Gemmatimonadales bacterium]|nr:carboxypeptidase regulatory-like domain-containing protein [Gemmatimonadales bacterium]
MKRIPYVVLAALVVVAATPGGAQAQWSLAAVDGPMPSLDYPARLAGEHVPLPEIAAERLLTAPGTVRGRVTDAATGLAVAQVQVTVMGTALGALTDDAGNYEIVGIPPGLYSIEARRIGYAVAYEEDVSVPDGGPVTVDFALGMVALTLDAMVVTGVTGEVSSRKLAFTVARVGDDKLEVPPSNALNAIQGKVAGASVVTGAEPGSGSNIVLRSPTSIYKSNSPLIVVDGVILASTFTRSSADLDALDIESIEIVKGAAGASLYGSRAANGVIQIRTRRGTALSEGQTRVTLRSEFGTNQLARGIDLSRHHQYLVDAQGRYVDTSGNIVDREDRVERPLSERYLDVPYLDPVYDHVDQFFSPGNYSNNSMSIGRNSANTNFYASYAYRREAGVVLENQGYKQHDLRINLDHRLGANLQFSVSAYHMRSYRAELPTDVFFNLVQQAPDADLLQPDPDGTPYIWQPDPLGVTPNPLYALAVLSDEGRRARTLASTDLRWAPIGWLSVDGNLSYDRSDRLGNLYFPRGKKTELQAYQDGFIENFDGVTTALNGSVSANAQGRVGDLSIRGTARALFEREDY